DVAVGQRLRRRDRHLLAGRRQPEAGQPAVEHVPRIVHFAVANEMDDGARHAPAACAAARAAAGTAAATRSTAASSCAALTNHASNADGGRCTPASSMAWK